MRWLRAQGFAVLPLRDAAIALLEGRLERRSVAITFDDGFRNNVSAALPILKQFELPATIYLTTGLIGSASTTWAGRITRALMATEVQTFEYAGQRFVLGAFNDKVDANRNLQHLVKTIAPEEPNIAAADIERRLGVVENPVVTGDADFEMLTLDDIAKARSSGLIDFGAHSVSHPILSALDDAQLALEVRESIKAVESLTQVKCDSFAYPNGQPTDYDGRVLELLRAEGVPLAVTTTQLSNRRDADPLRLSRWVLGGAIGLLRLKATIMGLRPDRFISLAKIVAKGRR